MANIFICRHGQDEDNLAGVLNGRRNRPLTDLGKEQARTTAEGIKNAGTRFDVVLSSPLLRAHQTASIIGDMIGLTVQTDDELTERDFGILAGRPLSDIPLHAGENEENLLKTDKVLYFLKVDGCETFDECYVRAQGVVKKIDSTYPSKNVLLVCHGDIGKMIMAVRQNISWKEALLKPYISNAEVLKL